MFSKNEFFDVTTDDATPLVAAESKAELNGLPPALILGGSLYESFIIDDSTILEFSYIGAFICVFTDNTPINITVLEPIFEDDEAQISSCKIHITDEEVD